MDNYNNNSYEQMDNYNNSYEQMNNYNNDYEQMDQQSGLEWVQLRESMDARKHKNEENIQEKLLRKIKENPLVPIGQLSQSLRHYFLFDIWLSGSEKGDSRKQQLMMRGRVLAQGFTIMAIVGGIMHSLANKAKQ